MTFPGYPGSDAPSFVQSVYDSPLATAVRESETLFPVLQTFHALGIMLMVGTIAVIDLRVLGVTLKQRSAHEVSRALLPLTWAGFLVMLVSGGVLLAAQSARIYSNDFLRAKLVLLVLAGLNVIFFHVATHRSIRNWGFGPSSAAAKTAAALSLALWAAVTVTGRFIAYF